MNKFLLLALICAFAPLVNVAHADSPAKPLTVKQKQRLIGEIAVLTVKKQSLELTARKIRDEAHEMKLIMIGTPGLTDEEIKQMNLAVEKKEKLAKGYQDLADQYRAKIDADIQLKDAGAAKPKPKIIIGDTNDPLGGLEQLGY